jgi:hypothetical protein
MQAARILSQEQRHTLESRRIAMIRSAMLFAVLAFAIPLYAQQKPLPDAPKPKTTRASIFVAGVSLLAAAKTADAITTRQLLDRGGQELNPIFGKHPSPAKQAGINAGIFAAQSFAFYLTERNRHAWVRWTGRALLAHVVIDHSQAAACNAGIDTHGPARNCGPLVF